MMNHLPGIRTIIHNRAETAGIQPGLCRHHLHGTKNFPCQLLILRQLGIHNVVHVFFGDKQQVNRSYWVDITKNQYLFSFQYYFRRHFAAHDPAEKTIIHIPTSLQSISTKEKKILLKIESFLHVLIQRSEEHTSELQSRPH